MSDTTTANKGRGRPTDYDPKYNELVKGMFRLGATDNEVIQSLGIARSTFYLWKQEHEAFLQACRGGKDFFDNNEIENTLLQKAKGGYRVEEVTVKKDAEGNMIEEITKTRTQPPDTGAIKYWLNNRNPKRWAEQPTIQEEEEQRADTYLKALGNAAKAVWSDDQTQEQASLKEETKE